MWCKRMSVPSLLKFIGLCFFMTLLVIGHFSHLNMYFLVIFSDRCLACRPYFWIISTMYDFLLIFFLLIHLCDRSI